MRIAAYVLNVNFLGVSAAYVLNVIFLGISLAAVANGLSCEAMSIWLIMNLLRNLIHHTVVNALKEPLQGMLPIFPSFNQQADDELREEQARTKQEVASRVGTFETVSAVINITGLLIFIVLMFRLIF